MIGCLVPGCPCPHSGAGRARAYDSPEDVEIVVSRARERHPSGAGLSKRDKIAVADRLTPQYSAKHIAAVLAVDPRTITRWRASLRLKENGS